MHAEAPRCEFVAGELALRLERRVAGDLRGINPLVDEIMVVVNDAGCVAGAEFEIELSLREALANAIEHGCGSDPSQFVQVLVECDPERGILVIVRDPGSGFDPRTVPSPVEGERLYSSGGRGIFLINALMDEVRHERGGTEIWMRKQPPARPQEPSDPGGN